MRIISFAILKEFGTHHPQIMTSLFSFYKIANSKELSWQKPQDVVNLFGPSRVDILKNNRVCIDLAGNNIRVVLKVEYGQNKAYVRWIGWHKDYITLGQKIHII